jgi:glycosyltransferase involved in cell wall biosynthesis
MSLVWILQTGEPLHIDEGHYRPMRAMNLANSLVERGHRVTLWSSDFFHQEKRDRFGHDQLIKFSDKLTIRLLKSRGYKSNIGIGRLVDHMFLAIKLKNILKSQGEKPDVVFVGYPPIETAYVLSAWLQKNGIPYLLDIKDLWPYMFLDVFPDIVRPLAKFILLPYFYMAKITMIRATGISTMAPPFLDLVLSYSGRKMKDHDGVFPLTSPPANINKIDIETHIKGWSDLGLSNTEKVVRIMFVGSFMSVFDFKPIKSVALDAFKSNKNIQFVLCGDGGSFKQIKSMFTGLDNVIFPGWINRSRIEALAKISDAAIAPYKNIDNYVFNTPNKVVDAFSLGLPILSPLRGEVERLISHYAVGISYGEEYRTTLNEAVDVLGSNKTLQQTMSVNALSLFNEKFSFDKVYNGLASHLETMIESHDNM